MQRLRKWGGIKRRCNKLYLLWLNSVVQGGIPSKKRSRISIIQKEGQYYEKTLESCGSTNSYFIPK